jgi:4-hydroxy-3-methylbut-2-enyl diphosphate reductase
MHPANFRGLLGTGTERGQYERRRRLSVRRLVLVAPRGYCAGVERAVDAVQEALSRWGPPIYLKTIDATRPLVAKVHAEARHYAANGYSIILLGHAGHEEVEGTMGEAPDATLLVQSVEEAERVAPAEADRLAYPTQTTLSVDDTAAMIDVLRRRFPAIEAPKREDICYAATNRQRAVKAILAEIELLLVIGSSNSSNSNRLVEVARARGVASYRIEDEGEVDERWLAGLESVGITAGASVPESLVQRVVSWFRERGVEEIRSQEAVAEDVSFRLPVELR